jgi:hypothetical protein
MSETKKEMEVRQERPQAIETKWAMVVLYGSNLVSNIVCKAFASVLSVPAFNDANHGVKTICVVDDKRIRNEKGEAVAAECYPLGGTVVISLEKCLENAVSKLIEFPFCSVFALYYLELMVSLAHEAYHCMLRVEGPREADADEEDEAAEFSLGTALEAAKLFSIEPPAWVDEPYFAATAMGMVEELGDEELNTRQQAMLDKRQFMMLAEADGVSEPFTAHTFRQFMHFQDETATMDDEAWLKTPADEDTAPLVTKAAETTTPTAPPADYVATVDELRQKIEDLSKIFGGKTTPVSGPITPPEDTVVGEVYEYDGDDSEPAEYVEEVYDEPSDVGEGWGEQTQPAAIVHPVQDLTVDRINEIVLGIFQRVYDHMFGYLFKGNTMLEDPSRVCQFPIQLTDEEKLVVIKMDCQDANGRWCPRANTTNGLLGGVFNQAKIPYYKLYINFQGTEMIRLLVPQNPNKVVNGQLTKTALLARQGNRIMYVFDGVDKAPGQKSDIKRKCVNGEWTNR